MRKKATATADKVEEGETQTEGSSEVEYNLYFLRSTGENLVFDVLYSGQTLAAPRIAGEIVPIGFGETFDLERIKRRIEGIEERNSLSKDKAFEVLLRDPNTTRELKEHLSEEREKERKKRDDRVQGVLKEVLAALLEKRVERKKIAKYIYIREPRN